MISLEDFDRYLKARPFQPFRIRVTEGVSYDIHHPELVMVGKRSVIVGVSQEGSRVYDRAYTVSLLHVVQLEPLDAPTAH